MKGFHKTNKLCPECNKATLTQLKPDDLLIPDAFCSMCATEFLIEGNTISYK